MNTLASLGLAVGLLSIASAAAIGQQGYPMVCHGGGDMNAAIAAGVIIINFEPTDVGTSVAPPAPVNAVGSIAAIVPGNRPLSNTRAIPTVSTSWSTVCFAAAISMSTFTRIADQ
jgi:hypothetical protein